MFAQNVGSIDRMARIVLGIILIAVGFFFMQGTIGIVAGIIGIVFLATGAIGWCPIYLPFNLNTCKK